MSLLLIVLTTCGCGAGDDGKSEFSGTVTWNGNPLPSGTIILAEGGDLDTAVIENGEFTIRAKPGTKKIVVTAEKDAGSQTDDRGETTQRMYQYIPAEFNDATTLTQQLTDSGAPIVVEMKGEERPAPSLTGDSQRRPASGGGREGGSGVRPGGAH
ncbi:MAG: hypothetical protein R3B90_09365 [Planctomycetaceae bacterium]